MAKSSNLSKKLKQLRAKRKQRRRKTIRRTPMKSSY